MISKPARENLYYGFVSSQLADATPPLQFDPEVPSFQFDPEADLSRTSGIPNIKMSKTKRTWNEELSNSWIMLL